MLRERNASMADRSLSSLTGELLLLATAAAAFATFTARRLGGDEYPTANGRGNGAGLMIWWLWAVRGWVIVRVVLDCGGRGGMEAYQETVGIGTRAKGTRHAWVGGGSGNKKGRVTKGQRAEVTGEGRGQEQCKRDPR